MKLTAASELALQSAPPGTVLRRHSSSPSPLDTADLTPMFEPGQRTAYASLSYGHIIGEVIRRADGRHIRQFLQEELAQPLGVDIYLGVPDEMLPRVATLKDGPAAPREYDARMVGEPAGSERMLR